MSKVSTYLHFQNTTEEAFTFYRSVFGGEFAGQGILRFGSAPPAEGAPPMPEAVRKMVMHVELPILGGHMLMSSDAPAELGFKLKRGDDIHIMLQPDTVEETKKLFDALSAGGKIDTPLEQTFWGALYGACTDRFGIGWMFNCQVAETGKSARSGVLSPIVISALVEADLERAWTCYTAPECVTRWNFASPDWHCPRARNDLRAGGTFSFRMESKDGKTGFDFGGVYEAVVEKEFISYKMDDGRMAKVVFHPYQGGVLVTVIFDPEASNSMELQRSGWQAILDNYKFFAESRERP